jgi:hypothetical protein
MQRLHHGEPSQTQPDPGRATADVVTDLKRLLRDSARGTALVVVGPHTDWLERPEEEQIYSERALQFIQDALRRKFKHERSGRFSPSAMGMCPRRVLFGYAGAPGLPPDIDNQEQMDHGSWTHLKWQAEGLTMGYMTDAEVWVYDEDLRCGGSMDAMLIDDTPFELKTSIWTIYSRVVQRAGWPEWEHLIQDATYMLLADRNMSSMVYEDRGSGQFHEFRIPRTDMLEREVLKLLKTYAAYADEDELPPMLVDCEMRTGKTYRRCPFRTICPKAKSVSEFGKVNV